ncbi:hypothetical protein DUNSADRAFT_6267 [Dunaliella salina]|uniref:Cilia- and flagella-associated protein 43 n=1 Tax=Dunaliella salina TaxID=3046 RepID=A0ABQ7GNK4_DUNSA|nr:hypothetical protein DUNSADRAFT_6267 [Dunaliella salina]|eukprot:KAF5836201.1 hypothetical protein DUNSADRAFT_6267 [Dunaliella salina]
MEAQALLTLGVAEGSNGPAWIDEKEVLFAFGNGVVAQHINKGSQRHVFGEANLELGASSADATVFATCPQKQVIAHAQSGLASAISIASATTLRPYCTIKDSQQQRAPWVHLALSHDGKHLASIGSYPDHVLDVWDLPEPPAPLKLGAKPDPSDPATLSARLVASATLGPRLAQLPPTFFPLNKSVLAVGGPEAVRLLFFDASVADNCLVRQSAVDLSALSEGHQVTAMGWTPAGALMLGTSGGKVMLVPGAAPCGLADADWGASPSCHKARTLFNSSVAARSKGWFDGLGNVMAVTCLPGQQTLAVVSPWPVGSKAKASKDAKNDKGGSAKASIQQPSCAHLMWLDTSGSTTTLAALAALPYGSLSSAAVSPSLEHVLLRTVAGDLALADTAYTIPEQLPRLTKTGTLAVVRMATRNKTVRMNKEHSGGSSSMAGARNRALQVVDEEEHNSSGTSTDMQPSDQGSPPSSSVRSRSMSRDTSMSQSAPGENGKSFKGSLPLGTAMAAVVNSRSLARYHAGRIMGVAAFDEEVFATGGEDATLRLWQSAHVSPSASLTSTPSGASTPTGSRPSSRMASRASSPLGFHLPPPPPRVPVLDASLVGLWRLHSPITILMRFANTPLVVAGTAAGEVHVLDTQKLMDHQEKKDKAPGAEDAAKEEAEAHAESAVWEQRPFNHGIAAMAFSSDGTLFSAASPDQNQVVLYKVVQIGSSPADITLQLLGFYEICQPYLLSFSPKDLSAIERNQAGAPPLLVVGTMLGELQLLHMLQSLNHLRTDDALIPPVSLLHGLLRVQSPITAMLTLPIMTAGGNADTTVLDGAFWLVACCADKSIKRIRMPQQQHCDAARAALSARAAAIEQQQRMGRSPPFSVPRVGMATSQNFQMPEIEKPMELDAPACHISLSQTNRQLVVSCLSGTVVVFGFPDLIAFARWPLHAPVPVQETALAQSLGSSRLPSPQQQHVRGGAAVLTTSLLVSVGPEGCVCMASLEGSSLLGIVGATRKYESSKTLDTSPKPTPRPASAAARKGHSVNGVPGLGSAILEAGQVRPDHSKVPPIVARSADTTGVLGWKEAPLDARRKSKAVSIEEAHEKLSAKKQDFARRLKELRALNASQGDEKLGDHEFVVDVALEKELRREADEVVTKAQTQAMVDIEVPEVMYHRILAYAKRSTQEQEQELVSLPEYRFISVLSADDAKRLKDVGSVVKVPGVSSYSIKRLNVDEADKLRKVTFLRRMEQEEWRQRPFYHRGSACLLRRWRGSLGGKPSESQEEVSQPNTSHAESQPDNRATLTTGADKEEELEEGNAAEMDRKDSGGAAADSRPLQQEEDILSLSATNASETGDMSARERESVKEDDVLGCEVYNGACHLLYSDLQLHAPTRKAAQTILLQEEIRCLQREFNSQFARLRTLKHQELERLNDKGKRIETIQNKYEPWMDQPRTSLSADQRKLMAELEKRAMEVMEECEKATRQLEMERKAVEADIYGHVVEFNAQVAALYTARLKADSQLRVFELQSIDLTQAIEELRAGTKARDQVSSMDKQLIRRRNLRTTLLTEAQAVAKKAALEYEEIQAQERALDRAMRRELTSVDEDLRDEAIALYRDRLRHVPRKSANSKAVVKPQEEREQQQQEEGSSSGGDWCEEEEAVE